MHSNDELSYPWTNPTIKRRSYKIYILLCFILLLLYILFTVVKNITVEEPPIFPSLTTSKIDLAVRGDIISADNFKVATSEKIYSATINTKSLDKNKIELFITLFSIYSNISKDEVSDIIYKSLENPGWLTISQTISSKDAINLQSLSYNLNQLDVFKWIKIHGKNRLYGLDIKEVGENRLYPYKDTLTPLIGYVRAKNNNSGKLREYGLKGIEKTFDNSLSNITNATFTGDRDIRSNIIYNANSIVQFKKDGDNVHLTIPLQLQKNIEIILDYYKEKFEAKEIIASIMDSTTGKILTLASSNRYNPSNIQQEEIAHLQVHAIDRPFEPGSVLKPITLSLALDDYKVTLDELFFAYNKGPINKKGEYKTGKIKIGRWPIRDDHKFKKQYLTLSDIIVYSSNIGTLQIVNKLSTQTFIDGLLKFGITQKTGIELQDGEKVGFLRPYSKLAAKEKNSEYSIYTSTTSYGQGMTTTFIQLMKAYSVFNNNGKIVTPYITQKTMINEPIQIISSKSANIMKELLIKTVQEGTGGKAQYKGLEIGGKTGTANVVRGGTYKERYNSSFFGFANDQINKYTIGVTVNEPIAKGKHWYYRYASNSAAPVFKEIVNTLVSLNYLQPD